MYPPALALPNQDETTPAPAAGNEPLRDRAAGDATGSGYSSYVSNKEDADRR